MGIWTNQMLAMALVALYLWDCLKSVSAQTRIVEQTPKGPRLLFSAFKFGKGQRTLINPFTPFFSIVITSPIGQGNARVLASPDARTLSYSVSQILIFVQLILVAIAAPVSLFYMRDQWFLISVLLSYLNFGILSFLFWKEGGRMRLPPKKRSALLLEALVCIPYSINLLRNFSLTQEVSYDLYGAFKQLPTEEQKRCARDMRQFLEEMDSSDDAIIAEYVVNALNDVTSIADD